MSPAGQVIREVAVRTAVLLLFVTGAVADYARSMGEGPLGLRYTGANPQWSQGSPEAHGFSSEALQARVAKERGVTRVETRTASSFEATVRTKRSSLCSHALYREYNCCISWFLRKFQ